MANTAKRMIDPDDAVLLLIDHQSGLFQLVKDMDLLTLRHNVTALAKAARLAKVPTFTTASVPDGPNGPLIPEIHECNPDAIYIPRTGQINAWDNPKWVEAIENTGRRTLVIAGTLTSVCMAFPTLSALEAGYKVFNVIDASGNWSSMATDITLARVVQAGAFPVDTDVLKGGYGALRRWFAAAAVDPDIVSGEDFGPVGGRCGKVAVADATRCAIARHTPAAMGTGHACRPPAMRQIADVSRQAKEQYQHGPCGRP